MMLSCLVSGVLHIDEWILSSLMSTIYAGAEWFLYTFLDDLVHLEYDLEEGRVVGEPKNPLTMLLIEWVELKEPELTYESVKKELEVSER